MDREEIEAALKTKYEAGECDTGLFNTGIQFVVMDNVNGELCFQWFMDAVNVADVL